MGRELIINAKRGREVNTTEYFPHLLQTSGKRNLKKSHLEAYMYLQRNRPQELLFRKRGEER